MDTKEKPVTLTYKAIITQNTGEVWYFLVSCAEKSLILHPRTGMMFL